MIPIEVRITNARRVVLNKEGNDEKLRLNLDCLDEERDKASSRMTKYQQKMAEYYNKRVKQTARYRRPRLAQSFSSNKRPKPRKARAHVGRTLQSRPLLPTRQLSLGNSRWTKASSPMEHQKLEEVPPVNVLDEFVLS